MVPIGSGPVGWAGKYRQYARMVSENGQGVVYFDGLVLDGWIVALAH
jgi:hypothetical protein